MNVKKLILTSAIGLAGLAGCDDHDHDHDNNNNMMTGVLPSQIVCESNGPCRIAAPKNNPITQDVTLTADKAWILQGGVFIGDDVAETVLTIEPGTIVYGDAASKAFLVITRNSKIIADGTKDAPIIFTSSKNNGERAPGDWGGLIINGKASVNGCTNAPCEPEGEGGTGQYGGSDDTDNSGTLRYVRVEFAGNPITPDNELNGIAFQGVGSGTTIEYIQVHMGKDDGVEFFGGTAQFKYILTTGISDDNLDWTDGWRGKGQYFIVQQYDGFGDNGIEADNNGDDNAASPRSNPILSNITLVGVPTSKRSDNGLLLREGTGAQIWNTIVVGFEDSCVDIDHTETVNNGKPVFKSVAISCNKPFTQEKWNCENDDKDDDKCKNMEVATGDAKEAWTVEDFFNTMDGGNLNIAWDSMSPDNVLMKAFDTAAPNFMPKAGVTLPTAAAVNDSFFDTTNYVGAVDPNATSSWTDGWTTSEMN